MTLAQLRYFLAAGELGSFTAAASHLHLSQPSLSEQIRRLESELGVALFIRVGRGVKLTDAGWALRPRAEELLAKADEALEAVTSLRSVRAGLVRFGMFRNAPHYALADVVAAFAARHEGVQIRLPGPNTAALADAVRAGELEAALVVLPIDDDQLDVRPIARDEVLYVTATRSRAGAPVSIEALTGAPLILYDAHYGSADPTRRQLAERAQRAGLKLEPKIDLEHVEAALELVARGVGDTFVARGLTRSRSFPDGLLTVPFAEPLYDTFALVKRRHAKLSPATRALASLAEERLLAHLRE